MATRVVDDDYDQPTVVDSEKLEMARRQCVADPDVTEDQIAAARQRLGSMSRVPRLQKPMFELRDRIDSARTAFLLAFVDGVLTLDVIVVSCGLPESDAVLILDKAQRDGLISIGD